MAPADPGDLAGGPGRRPRPPYEEQRKPLLQRIFGPLLVAGAILLKFGKVGLLLLTKAKFLTTSASMLVSVAAYALIWGWKFAAGFVALLFIHEMGHYIQLRREGVKPSGMVFIPFLGAAVGTRSLGGSAHRRGACRPGRPDPRLDRLPDPGRAVGRHRRGVLAGARVHRLLPQPLQPDPGRAVRRRPRDGGDDAVDVVRRPRRDGRAAARGAEPVRAPVPRARRRSRPTSAGRTARRARRATRTTTASSPRTGSRSASSTWACSCCSASGWT